jgi:hypothetical protein
MDETNIDDLLTRCKSLVEKDPLKSHKDEVPKLKSWSIQNFDMTPVMYTENPTALSSNILFDDFLDFGLNNVQNDIPSFDLAVQQHEALELGDYLSENGLENSKALVETNISAGVANDFESFAEENTSDGCPPVSEKENHSSDKVAETDIPYKSSFEMRWRNISTNAVGFPSQSTSDGATIELPATCTKRKRATTERPATCTKRKRKAKNKVQNKIEQKKNGNKKRRKLAAKEKKVSIKGTTYVHVARYINDYKPLKYNGETGILPDVKIPKHPLVKGTFTDKEKDACLTAVGKYREWPIKKGNTAIRHTIITKHVCQVGVGRTLDQVRDHIQRHRSVAVKYENFEHPYVQVTMPLFSANRRCPYKKDSVVKGSDGRLFILVDPKKQQDPLSEKNASKGWKPLENYIAQPGQGF